MSESQILLKPPIGPQKPSCGGGNKRHKAKRLLRRSHTWTPCDLDENIDGAERKYKKKVLDDCDGGSLHHFSLQGSVPRLYKLVRSKSVNSVKQLVNFFEQKVVRKDTILVLYLFKRTLF